MNVGQVYGTGAGIADPPAVITDSDEQSFWGEVEKFKRKADEAYTLWQKLRAKRQAAASNPGLQAEYDDVMNEAENITAKVSDVERVTAQIKGGVYETITSWFGLEGLNTAKQQLGQLGFLPVIAIALVTAAIAWLGTWIVKGNIIDRKLTAVESLIGQGVSARDAGALVEEKGDPGVFGNLFSNIGTGIAFAGVAAGLLYFFYEKKRGF
jgi:hypothetical protein